ncbi:MAG: hypothetical protein KDK78_08190, partial [Chlamydiia bacterium]|nr:hypothetical protein [Chlamydiia bacterium]
DFGANPNLPAAQYRFERKITDVRRRIEYVPEPKYVGGDKKNIKVTLESRPRERVTVHTEDSRSEENFYRLDSHQGIVPL